MASQQPAQLGTPTAAANASELSARLPALEVVAKETAKKIQGLNRGPGRRGGVSNFLKDDNIKHVEELLNVAQRAVDLAIEGANVNEQLAAVKASLSDSQAEVVKLKDKLACLHDALWAVSDIIDPLLSDEEGEDDVGGIDTATRNLLL